MERKDTTVPIQKETKKDLEEWRSPGQSFDGAIRELLQTRKAEVKA